MGFRYYFRIIIKNLFLVDWSIEKVTEGLVKQGALEKGLTNDELEKSLNEIVKIF